MSTALVRLNPPLVREQPPAPTREQVQHELSLWALALYGDGHETVAYMLLMIVDACRRCQALELYDAMLVWKATR